MLLRSSLTLAVTMLLALTACSSSQMAARGPSDPAPKSAPAPLRILPSNPVIAVGASLQLRVTVEQPGTEVTLPYTWTSSDMHVVTVNQQGLLRGVDIGRAVITVTSYEGIQGSLVVEVSP